MSKKPSKPSASEAIRMLAKQERLSREAREHPDRLLQELGRPYGDGGPLGSYITDLMTTIELMRLLYPDMETNGKLRHLEALVEDLAFNVAQGHPSPVLQVKRQNGRPRRDFRRETLLTLAAAFAELTIRVQHLSPAQVEKTVMVLPAVRTLNVQWDSIDKQRLRMLELMEENDDPATIGELQSVNTFALEVDPPPDSDRPVSRLERWEKLKQMLQIDDLLDH